MTDLENEALLIEQRADMRQSAHAHWAVLEADWKLHQDCREFACTQQGGDARPSDAAARDAENAAQLCGRVQMVDPLLMIFEPERREELLFADNFDPGTPLIEIVGSFEIAS